jgi:hypothetical protein
MNIPNAPRKQQYKASSVCKICRMAGSAQESGICMTCAQTRAYERRCSFCHRKGTRVTHDGFVTDACVDHIEHHCNSVHLRHKRLARIVKQKDFHINMLQAEVSELKDRLAVFKTANAPSKKREREEIMVPQYQQVTTFNSPETDKKIKMTLDYLQELLDRGTIM